MLFKITYAQIRKLLAALLLALTVWLLMGHLARFHIMEMGSEGQVIVNVSFLAPMSRESAVKHLSVTGEIPGREVKYSTCWISRNTVRIIIDESEYPRGLEYRVSFKKAPALIPPFSVSVQKDIRQGLAPRVIALVPQGDVPTEGPLAVVFNTPVNPESFAEHVTTSAPGQFSPQTVRTEGGELRYDYSRWLLTPRVRFKNKSNYNILIAPGLMGTGGGVSREGAELSFSTAPALELTDLYPGPSAPSIWLSRSITLKANLKLRQASIQVEGISGKVTVEENTAIFDPDELFLPAREYHVNIALVSEVGEKKHVEFSFATTNLGNQRWIGIKAGNPCSLQIYEGNRLLKELKGWLSISPDRVPRVTMYETKRGSTREYRPDDPSPISYLRLNADFMLHHVRGGESDTHNLIGLPPSYGCILINKPDMDWILDNVPGNCMVIVH
ncbi:MAG: L,D-transpeptidase family protein [Desulfocucumaceae bacterium]